MSVRRATLPFCARAPADRLRDVARTLWHWVYSNVHLAQQTYHVLDAITFRRLGPGLLPADHPWVTGVCPETGRFIWPDNIVYRSPPKTEWLGPAPESDDGIAIRTGKFLGEMVRRSIVADPEIPQGARRRMPHGVNYLHGPIHYNGCYAILNDFEDGMFHLSDPAFAREVRRFARIERRELTIVFRERRYHPGEYAWFVAFVRSHLPWYANGNGPTKRRVLWGTPAPYANVNPINGSWVRDLQQLRRGRLDGLLRPPLSPGRYFRERYRGNQPDFTFLERFHAWAQWMLISAKGFQGNLAFTKRRRIEPEHWEAYRRGDGDWPTSYAVPHPFGRIATVRAARGA